MAPHEITRYLKVKEITIFVMSQNATSRNISMFKGQNGGVRKLPFVFTEKCICMLMTVLKGH